MDIEQFLMRLKIYFVFYTIRVTQTTTIQYRTVATVLLIRIYKFISLLYCMSNTYLRRVSDLNLLHKTLRSVKPVSYTHLDVYKRQGLKGSKIHKSV